MPNSQPNSQSASKKDGAPIRRKSLTWPAVWLFWRSTEQDRQRLHELAPQFEVARAGIRRDVLSAFVRVRRDGPLSARSGAGGPAQAMQQAHLESMLEADWNDDYVARRFRVGDVHAQVGISPQIFLGAYNQYLQFCMRHLAAQSDSPAIREFAEQMVSLQKAVFLDIGLDARGLFHPGHAKSAQGVGPGLSGQYGTAAICPTDVARFEDAAGHDGQLVRRGAWTNFAPRCRPRRPS